MRTHAGSLSTQVLKMACSPRRTLSQSDTKSAFNVRNAPPKSLPTWKRRAVIPWRRPEPEGVDGPSGEGKRADAIGVDLPSPGAGESEFSGPTAEGSFPTLVDQAQRTVWRKFCARTQLGRCRCSTVRGSPATNSAKLPALSDDSPNLHHCFSAARCIWRQVHPRTAS